MARPAEDLHEAATELRWFYSAIDDLLTDMAPRRMDYFDRRAAMGDDECDGYARRCGYAGFWQAAHDLAELLRSVEEDDCADTRRRLLGT